MLSRTVTVFVKPNIVNTVTARLIHTTGMASTKVAVVLSGCGVYDGSEVHEASAVLVHLSRGGATVSMFAPDKQQMHVINHTKGEPMEPNRNVLVESARIARGEVEALGGLKAQNFDAVIFPGGFGAAKNLSTFATEGTAMSVDKDVERVLKEFHSSSKPIGLCCIAPVLAAKVVSGCEVTIGSDEDTAGAIEAMGAKHVKKTVTESHVDNKNKIVTTPAYMLPTGLHHIFDGIGTMVSAVLGMAKK